jgi:hypothetical protein
LVRRSVDVAVVAKTEVLVALPAWLVCEVAGGEDVGDTRLVLRKRDHDVADAVLLKEDGEHVVTHHVHDFEMIRLV